MNKIMRWCWRTLKWRMGITYVNAECFDMASLPDVGLGAPLPSDAPFQGAERPFFELYVKVLGKTRANEIVKQHGFERSALYGLHNEAVKLKAISRDRLLSLTDGHKEMIGFAFQPPALAMSWRHPFEQYRAERDLGQPIYEPVTFDKWG